MKRGKRLLGNSIRVLTLLTCVLVFGVSLSRAQVRPPGGIGGGPPPGGIGGMVGGFPQPGGIGGVPQPGAIGGVPQPGGIGGVPQPGAIGGMPQPGAIGGPPPGGIGGGPPPGSIGGGIGGGDMVVWKCTRCGRVLSTGKNPPIGQKCACGVVIDRAIGPGGALGGPPPGAMGGGPPPGGIGGGPPLGAMGGGPPPGGIGGGPMPGAMGGGPPPGGIGGGPMPGGMPPQNMPNKVKAPVVKNQFDDFPDDEPRRNARQEGNTGFKVLLFVGGLVAVVFLLGVCALGGLLLVIFYNRSQEGY